MSYEEILGRPKGQGSWWNSKLGTVQAMLGCEVTTFVGEEFALFLAHSDKSVKREHHKLFWTGTVQGFVFPSSPGVALPKGLSLSAGASDGKLLFC